MKRASCGQVNRRRVEFVDTMPCHEASVDEFVPGSLNNVSRARGAAIILHGFSRIWVEEWFQGHSGLGGVSSPCLRHHRVAHVTVVILRMPGECSVTCDDGYRERVVAPVQRLSWGRTPDLQKIHKALNVCRKPVIGQNKREPVLGGNKSGIPRKFPET